MQRASLIGRRTVRKVAATAIAAGAASLLVLPHAVGAAGLDVGLNEIEGTIALGTRDVRATVASIINVAMGLLGIVAVVIILAGGFMWMTAAGAEEKVTKAKKLIFSGIIGLAIILSAFAIAKFVVNSLVDATSNTPPAL
ncbi:MAG: pilin [bacterium]|nr:pilin [bacterium]